MKNQSLRIINNTRKKSIYLTGNLAMSLRIGERAWINTHGQTLMTSVVIKILEVSQTGVVFETKNTIYNLNYTAVPTEVEVMCA